MKLIRAVPEKIPDNRNYVVDQLDTFPMSNYDMHFLKELNDDVILLEWDIAVAHHDLVNFIIHARNAPNLVQVAPYILYPTSTDLPDTVWAHRTMVREIPLQLDWIDYGQPVCDLFSTGMIYLPKHIIDLSTEADSLITWHDNLNDSKLAFWYYYHIKKKVPVHWDIRPIHLHYSVDRIYDEPDIDHYTGSRRDSMEEIY